jgi:hypothetical protein
MNFSKGLIAKHREYNIVSAIIYNIFIKITSKLSD